MSEDREYGLIVSFPDQSHSFVHGFEAGEIWKDMERREEIKRNVHTANRLVIERMADALGYDLAFEDCALGGVTYDEWLVMTATPTPEAPPRSRFRVVQGGLSDA